MINRSNRRTFLKTVAGTSFGRALGFGMGIAPALSTTSRAAQAPPLRIFAAGGGFVSSLDPDRRLLRFVLSLARVSSPQVCSLPTASGDNPDAIVSWYELMHTLDCRPRHLRIFGPTNRLRRFEEQLLNADVIFVPGGNTLNMLAVWRDQGVDLILRKAWEQGTVLAGESAGMICWFEQGMTDSRPEELGALSCLGLLKGSACPHYNNPQRRPAYHALLKQNVLGAGIACDDGAGVLYENTSLAGAYSLSEKAAAYKVSIKDSVVSEEQLPATILPRPS